MEVDKPIGTELPLMESFHTIQGEGFFQGHAAYFIRLGGCDVGCVWCDVKDSWDATSFPRVFPQVMAEKAAESNAPIAVVTGGEPLMYELAPLTRALKTQGLQTHLETSGVYPITGEWDWICFSPKKFKTPHESIYPLAHELKVIVYHPSDLAWAEQFRDRVSPSCKLYLQPEWSKEKNVLPLIVEYVKAHPEWQVSLQIHKYMNIP